MHVCQLTHQDQNTIKQNITAKLQKEGYTPQEIKETVSLAMCSRVSDLD